MWNTIKSSHYQTVRDNYTYYALLAGLCYLGIGLMTCIDELGSHATGSLFMRVNGEICMMVWPIFLVSLTSRICGWDFTDKTVNYEVLYGNSRSSIYFGRFFVSLLWSLCSCTLSAVLLPGIYTLLYGWGVSIALGTAAVHYLLALTAVFRFVCLVTALTFLLQNNWAAMILCFVAFFGGMILYVLSIEEMISLHLTWQLSMTSLCRMLDLSNTAMGFADGKDVMIIKSGLDAAEVTETLVSSFAGGLLYLFAGFAVFRKRDLP